MLLKSFFILILQCQCNHLQVVQTLLLFKIYLLFLYCLFALLVEEICFFLAVPLFCNIVDLVDSEFVSIIEHAENIKVLLLALEGLQAL